MPPGSPTLKRLKEEGRWDDKTQAVCKPRGLFQLPDELIGHIAQHMDYAALTKWMMTCRTMHAHCFNTWRGQALLLRTCKWGTPENYRAVFERHVVNKGLPIEPGVHIVYSYCSKHRTIHPSDPEYGELNTGTKVRDWPSRLERAQVVLHNAKNVYMEMAATKTSAGVLKVLSAIHMPLQVNVLKHSHVDTDFKQVILKMVDGKFFWFPPQDLLQA